MRALATCAVFWAACLAVPALSQSPVGPVIQSIRFEPARQPLTPQELSARVKIVAGAPLDRSQVRATIESLFETGRYRDIRVETGSSAAGAEAIIRTEPAWFIGDVQVTGVPEPPSQGQLVAVTGLRLGEPYYEDSLEAAVKALAETLRHNGFQLAQIRTETHQSDGQQVAVIFAVTPGRRARFSRPTITGAKAEEISGILNASRWRSYRGLLGWKELTETRLNQGLERIRAFYAEKNYLLNQVTLTGLDYSAATGRVTPRLTIAPGPLIELKAEGISRDEIRRLVPIYQEQAVDRDLLNEGARNITEHLRSQGYFDSKVSYQFLEQTPQRQVIEYAIDRGVRHKLRAIHIAGNKYFDRKTITERMGITAATRVRYRNGRFSESMLAADAAAIRDLYISNGFRDVVVNTRIEDIPGAADKAIEVSLEIIEGRQWLVDSLKFEGSDPAYEEALRARTASQPGQPFSEANVAIDRDQILRAYYDSGYTDAAFDWTLEPSPNEKQVALTFRIKEGPQRTVRGVLINGLATSHPSLVASRLRLREGDVLSQAQLIESQRRLYDLGVFARVNTALQNPDGDESAKNIVMQFEEGRRYSFSAGFGAEVTRIGGSVGNILSATGNAGFSPRVSATLSRYNLFGVGHTASLQGRLSNLQQRALISYLAPHFIGREGLSLNVTGFHDLSRNIQTFRLRRQEVSGQLNQTIGRGLSAQGRFAFRRSSPDNVAAKFPPELVGIFARPVRVGIFSGSLIRDRRDDPIDAQRGNYNYIDVGFASRKFGGSTAYFRVLGRNSSYHRIGRDLILARSFAFGFQKNLDAGKLATDIPLAERIFSGGGNSHRGFPENQAGPRDPATGFPVGGGAQLLNNIELRFPILGEFLGGVLFHDAGNVYSSLENVSFRLRQRNNQDFDYMVHAAGIGFRIRTPVGPVRADFAYVPNRSSFFGFRGTRDELISGGGQYVNQKLNWFQFHISLGQAF